MEQIAQKLLGFLENYLKNSGKSGFVLGISGGIDSAVSGALCAKIAPVYALIMPTNSSNPQNLNDATTLCESLQINYKIINISPIIAAFTAQSGDGDSDKMSVLRLANITARVRMTLLFDASAKYDCLVAGTTNLSERLLGYGTIYGDMACSLNPLGNLFKTQIYELAKYLGIPQNIINKAPSADLWEGQSDEGELGYSYEQIDPFLKAYINSEDLSRFDKAMREQLISRIAKNSFKLNPPAIPEP